MVFARTGLPWGELQTALNCPKYLISLHIRTPLNKVSRADSTGNNITNVTHKVPICYLSFINWDIFHQNNQKNQ